MDDLSAQLRNTSIFKHASQDQLQALQARKDCRTLCLAAGELLPDTSKYLGLLLEGTAQVLSTDSGRTVILRILSAGDIFGAAALFCPEEFPLSRIEAENACRVFAVSKEAILELVCSNRGVLEAYFAFLAGRVRYLNRKICCFTAGTAPRRLALWLLSEEHDTVTLPASLSAFSDMLDIGRASLYRAFDNLSAAGLIHKNGRNITILDRKRLSEYYK